jgi:hypothetical protein
MRKPLGIATGKNALAMTTHFSATLGHGGFAA